MNANPCAQIQDELPLYAAGTLSPERREVIDRHLAGCAPCRQDLALWVAVREQVADEDRQIGAPSAATLTSVKARLQAERSRPPASARAVQLLRSQVPLVRREVWSASLIVMAAGCLLSLSQQGANTSLLAVVAPLVAAAGVAMIYGPENDPALELALATPTSPRQVLLARLVLVFGYDLVLALGGSLALATIGGPAYVLGELIVSWLGPMVLLSALALTLSLWIGAGNGAAVAFTLWLARWLLPRSDSAGALPAGVPGLATMVHGFAVAADYLGGSPPLQFGMAALLLALALRQVDRSDLPRRTTWT